MKLPPLIQKELDLIEGRYRIERGRRHLRILVDGRFVAILPHDGLGNDSSQRGALNVRAEIRRAIKYPNLEVGFRRRSGPAAQS